MLLYMMLLSVTFADVLTASIKLQTESINFSTDNQNTNEKIVADDSTAAAASLNTAEKFRQDQGSLVDDGKRQKVEDLVRQERFTPPESKKSSIGRFLQKIVNLSTPQKKFFTKPTTNTNPHHDIHNIITHSDIPQVIPQNKPLHNPSTYTSHHNSIHQSEYIPSHHDHQDHHYQSIYHQPHNIHHEDHSQHHEIHSNSHEIHHDIHNDSDEIHH